MPFNTLLLTCLSTKRSFSEAGGRIRFNQDTNETILLFVIDQESNRNSTVYQDFIKNGPVCDLIIYYIKDNEKIICFIELKGSDIQKAIEQIENTFNKFRKSLEQSTRDKDCCPHCTNIRYKSYILLHGSAPRLTKDHGQRLEHCFGRGNVSISRCEDISNFIRN